MIRLRNIITETSLSDDDLLDIILTYTKDPDEAEDALASYRETGDFGDASISSTVQRDPRFRLAAESSGAGARLAAAVIERARRAMRSMPDADVATFREHIAQAFDLKL
jgi:hypothetical protein